MSWYRMPLVEHVIFVFVVEHWYHVAEAVFVDADDVFDVLFFLEAVADDDFLLVDKPLCMQFLYQVDVESRRGLEVDVVLQGLLEHEGEVTALGAVAIVVSASVVGFCDGHVEQALGALYLRADLGQVGDFQRCAILLDDFHQRYVVEIEFAVLGAEFVLRKVESLVNQVVILVLHVNRFV